MTNILLTGGSRGIGAAAREMLAARDANVIVHASAPRDGVDISADLADESAVETLWNDALEQAGGRIDVLVNNAGLFEANAISAEPDAWLRAWRHTMDVNLTASAQLSYLAVRHWLSDGASGRLVHVASRAGHRGDSPDHWHYAASKGGMLAMHKSIARGYADRGILSYAIAPGFTDTSMAGDYLASRGGDGLLADIPLGAVARPEEIGGMVVYCALDAPPSMTGATLDANGASYVR